MTIRRLAVACAAALAFCLPAAHALTLDAGAGWAEFYVDDLSSATGGVEWIDVDSGAALSFDFTVPVGYSGTLTVVDAGFAGDRFAVLSGGTLLGHTGASAGSFPDSIGADFDAALADGRYSRGVFTLGAGQYSITGLLSQSVLLDGQPLNATIGGVRLEVSPVPEPMNVLLFAAGLPVLMASLHRRRGGRQG